MEVARQIESLKEVIAKLDSPQSNTAFLSKEKPKGLKAVLDGNAGEIEFPDLEADYTPSVDDKAAIDGNLAHG